MQKTKIFGSLLGVMVLLILGTASVHASGSWGTTRSTSNVDNDVSVRANTGNNQSNGNTIGGSVTTGRIDTSVRLNNQTGSSNWGSNWGNWMWGGNSTTRSNVDNDVRVGANTGNNQSNGNTIGGTIRTGDIETTVAVNNSMMSQNFGNNVSDGGFTFTHPSAGSGGNVMVNGENFITGPNSVNTNLVTVNGLGAGVDISALNHITGPHSVNRNVIRVMGNPGWNWNGNSWGWNRIGTADIATGNTITGPFSVNTNTVNVVGRGDVTISATNSITGPHSINHNVINLSSTCWQSNRFHFVRRSMIRNNVNVWANTGRNYANWNTIGGSIRTGDINTWLQVNNE